VRSDPPGRDLRKTMETKAENQSAAVKINSSRQINRNTTLLVY